MKRISVHSIVPVGLCHVYNIQWFIYMYMYRNVTSLYNSVVLLYALHIEVDFCSGLTLNLLYCLLLFSLLIFHKKKHITLDCAGRIVGA